MNYALAPEVRRLISVRRVGTVMLVVGMLSPICFVLTGCGSKEASAQAPLTAHGTKIEVTPAARAKLRDIVESKSRASLPSL